MLVVIGCSRFDMATLILDELWARYSGATWTASAVFHFIWSVMSWTAGRQVFLINLISHYQLSWVELMASAISLVFGNHRQSVTLPGSFSKQFEAFCCSLRQFAAIGSKMRLMASCLAEWRVLPACAMTQMSDGGSNQSEGSMPSLWQLWQRRAR